MLIELTSYISPIKGISQHNQEVILNQETIEVVSTITQIDSIIETASTNSAQKAIREILTHIKPIQSDINVLVPLNMNIPNAYVSTLELMNRAFKIENMTQVSYILNPSHVEVRK